MTGSRRWLAALGVTLALSLAGNLLLAGILLGRHAGERPHMSFLRPLPGAPEAARDVLHAAFREHRGEMREQFHAHREARQRLAAALAEPDLDPAALDRALADLAAATSGLQATAHTIMRDAAVRMPPEVRRDWAGNWRQRASRDRHHGGAGDERRE
ncbi:hypothetical protein PC39_15824 [Salinisphaera sp. PC39]|uniref:periplasmic heavy metal sensor n=1 Tax=Salinisphaera sp. PC39 TaxID=1304156 RepID=UPI0033423953